MSDETIGNVIIGLVWIAIGVGWLVLARFQSRHKARMDAHDAKFIPLGYSGIKAQSPLQYYVFAVLYFAMGVCWTVWG
jgi:hypothetical protein